MKIGIVWENGVSKWMSQMFEPLMDIPGVDINVFVGERNKFDVKDVRLRKRNLTHREEILRGLYSLVSFSGHTGKKPYRRMHFYLNSLDKHLKGYDIVECHDSSRSLYTLSELKRRKGFKLVVSYLENIPYRQVFDDKTNYIKKSTYEMVDHFIPWCDTIKDVLLLEGAPPEKVTRVYTGVDLSLFKPAPPDRGLLDEYDIRARGFTILYIGKLTSWKGVHMLAYAAKVLESKGYGDFRIVVAGRGAQLENLKKIISEAGVDEHFRFAG
ncbi:MAG: glycosyltransferase, partial [Deltaproteobacteria bacterium]